jgi:uncharacterized membrane protein
MPRRADEYTPLADSGSLRRQAVKVVAITGIITAAWVLLIVSPPLLYAAGFGSAGSSVFGFFSTICHQIPERSFHWLGHQLGVCSRCFGVYAGLFAAVVAYPLWRAVENIEPLPRIWLLLSVVPMAIDWALTVFGIWENTFFTRTLTGLILGFACGVYILPALVEITRNFRPPARRAAA